MGQIKIKSKVKILIKNLTEIDEIELRIKTLTTYLDHAKKKVTKIP
jgi:hypothetical protein